jgi:hypothetical protein
MQVQITDSGIALMNNANGPLTMTGYVLGDGFDYVPTSTQTALRGTQVKTGVPAAPIVAVNSVKYAIHLSESDGPFQFGEALLIYNNVVFAVCVLDNLVTKLPASQSGGAYILEIFTSTLSSNYEMWANAAFSSNLRASALVGPEILPVPTSYNANVYVLSSKLDALSSYLAYTDRQGLWNFDKFTKPYNFQIQSGTKNQLRVLTSALATFPFLGLGTAIVQGTKGNSFGICRYIASLSLDNDPTYSLLTFDTPLTVAPGAGDTFRINALPSAGNVTISNKAGVVLFNL